ncbi:MAG: sulfatase-like hydrolase/transferase [Deltaproteobacteria bacterium]|nr:sulfatase-like hydrolase/transferase [Deltaproteobacteria bacterium]
MFLLLTLACAQAPSPAAPAEKPPNILIFTLDTTRTDGLGSYGSRRGLTPHLDALATHAARFDRAYTVTPLTIPAHSSLFTGLLPPRHGVQDNGDFFLRDSATTLAELLKGEGYQTMASVGAEVTSHHWGFAQGFDSYYDEMGSSEQDEENRWRVERPGDEVVADALRWFDQRGQGAAPWFAWVHLFDVHHPYTPPEPYASRFKHPYYAEVAWVDALVQRTLDGLEQRGELDNTWVFVMSDHGEGLGQHGEALHGVLLYDVTTRVPLIIRPPKGLSEARVISFPVSLVDVMPTALAIAGAAPPPVLDGINLLPWLGEAPAPPLRDREVYVESVYAWRHYGWAPQKALVDDTLKLIDSTTPELYSRKDPMESQDLAAKKTAKVQELQDRLHALTAALVREDATAGQASDNSDRLAMLEMLGYVTGTVDTDGPTEGLPDPVTQLPLLKGIEAVRAAHQARDLPKARALAEEVLAQDPHLMDLRQLLAQILAEQGNRDEAIAMLEAIEAERPSGASKVPLANMLLATGQTGRALELLDQAIDSDPFLASAWLARLRALQALDPDRFPTAAEEAARRFPSDATVQGLYGVSLAQAGESQRAEQVLSAALAEEPLQSQVRHALGLIALQRGDAPRAEELWLEELGMFPTALPVRRALVALYAEQGRYPEQLTQLEAIRTLEPPNHLTLHSQGQALFNLGRYPEARGQVELCMETAPDYPACAMLYANVLDKLGDRDGAVEAYHLALSLGEAATQQVP